MDRERRLVPPVVALENSIRYLDDLNEKIRHTYPDKTLRLNYLKDKYAQQEKIVLSYPLKTHIDLLNVYKARFDANKEWFIATGQDPLYSELDSGYWKYYHQNERVLDFPLEQHEAYLEELKANLEQYQQRPGWKDKEEIKRLKTRIREQSTRVTAVRKIEAKQR